MGRKFPLLPSCVGCPLKTGAIVAGVYGIVTAIFALIMILTNDIKIQTIIIDFLPKSIEYITLSYRSNVNTVFLAIQNVLVVIYIKINMKIIVIINLLMTILISSLLLAGVFMRRKTLMLPWIVLTIMLCIGLVISVIYTSIDFLVHKFYITSIAVLVIGLLIVCVYVYMWWVTYSYYQKIKEEDNRTPYTRTPYYH